MEVMVMVYPDFEDKVDRCIDLMSFRTLLLINGGKTNFTQLKDVGFFASKEVMDIFGGRILHDIHSYPFDMVLSRRGILREEISR